MKKAFEETVNKPAEDPIVILDECGDSLWDAVLQQEVKTCDVKISKTTASLLSSIDAVKVSDTTEAK